MQRISIYTPTDHFLSIQNSINADRKSMQRILIYNSFLSASKSNSSTSISPTHQNSNQIMHAMLTSSLSQSPSHLPSNHSGSRSMYFNLLPPVGRVGGRGVGWRVGAGTVGAGAGAGPHQNCAVAGAGNDRARKDTAATTVERDAEADRRGMIGSFDVGFIFPRVQKSSRFSDPSKRQNEVADIDEDTV